MAPFPLLARQESPVVITLTAPTTTTAITLGGADATGAASAPTSTSSNTFVAITPTSSGGTSQSTVIGAILGCFFGACVLFLILWWCCYNGIQIRFFKTRRYPSSSYYSGSRTTRSVSDSSISSSSASRSRVRIRVSRRGGGFSRRNSRGNSVKVPVRAESRRERRGSAGNRTVFERRRRRRSSVTKGRKAPFLGFMMPAATVVETRKVKRDSWASSGKGGDRLKFSVDD